MKLSLTDDQGVVVDIWGKDEFPNDEEVIYDPEHSLVGMPEFLKNAMSLWRSKKLLKVLKK